MARWRRRAEAGRNRGAPRSRVAGPELDLPLGPSAGTILKRAAALRTEDFVRPASAGTSRGVGGFSQWGWRPVGENRPGVVSCSGKTVVLTAFQLGAD
jgi:hypothetical protein